MEQHPYDELLGPFYDANGAQKYLGLTADQLLGLVEEQKILSLVTSDGSTLFPTFQFKDGQVDRNIIGVLNTFHGSGVDGWAIAWLLSTKDSRLGTTPRQYLENGGQPMSIVWLAAEARNRWTAP